MSTTITENRSQEAYALESPREAQQLNDRNDQPAEVQSSTEHHKFTKYIVLVAGSLVLFVGVGYSNTFGVFQEYYEKSILRDEPQDKIITIGSTAASLYLILGVFAGRFADLVGYRISLLIGTALMTGAMFAASVSTTFEQLFASQGLMFGFGIAFAYLPATSISRQYWAQNHGVANAIVVSGGALGGCILPYFVRLMIENLGLAQTFRVLGYIAAGVLVPSSLLLKPKTKTVPIWKTRGQAQSRPPLLDLSLLRDDRFLAMVVGCTIAMIGFLPRYFLIPPSAVSQGIGTTYASWLLGLMNGLSIIGRIGIGWFADRYGKVTALTLSFILCGLGHFAFWLPAVTIQDSNTVTALFTLFVVYVGVFGSGFISLFPVVIAHLFGSDALASKNGLLNTILGLGTLAGPTAVYAIVGEGDKPHWWLGVLVAGLFMFVGGVVMGVLLAVPRKGSPSRRNAD